MPQPLPLFYRAPEALSLERHRSWRLKEGDYGFAAQTPYVPLVIGEFVAASRHYPILFADGTVLLGWERSAPDARDVGFRHTNHSVDPRRGNSEADARSTRCGAR